MKRVLYISNIEVPYRTRFFNELARYCDLTVLYERQQSSNRDKAWTQSEKSRYAVKYLGGVPVKGEFAFSLSVFRELFADYDEIVIGCYNSPVQMLSIMALNLLRYRYIVNLDGEQFFNIPGIKSRMKLFFLRGAYACLTAGERSMASLNAALPSMKVIPYYFSSLSEREILEHARQRDAESGNNTVLVVGQYFDYKGMNIAVKVAAKDPSRRYEFVGMGSRTELFARECRVSELKNVEMIPFLPKEELMKKMASCAMLLLPSQKECWGLVVNEAASFGTPIVSTWGSGAAVEFCADRFPQYLAPPGNPDALLQCVIELSRSDRKAYSEYLLQKSRQYSIEKSAAAYAALLCADKK